MGTLRNGGRTGDGIKSSNRKQYYDGHVNIQSHGKLNKYCARVDIGLQHSKGR